MGIPVSNIFNCDFLVHSSAVRGVSLEVGLGGRGVETNVGERARGAKLVAAGVKTARARWERRTLWDFTSSIIMLGHSISVGAEPSK